MSKTFENVHTEYGGSMIVREEGDCVSVSINMVNPSDTSIHIAPSDAPALALAILEAAGIESPYYNLKDAVDNLRQHVEREAQHASEAEAQAKLEAEALELANSAVLVVGNPPYPSIEHMGDTSLRKWLAVARRARELNKEASNGR